MIVCNPNNPTSTALPLGEIAAFLDEVPRHVAVILDEAYCEFNLLDDPDASLALLDRHSNLVLLRTFSKVYGLCGLRVGFALCGSEEFPMAVDQVRQPFFFNSAAQAAATEALRHQDEVARRVERDRRRPASQLEDGLRARAADGRVPGQFRLVAPPRGRREPEIVARPRGARRARPRRRGARPRRRAAHHLGDRSENARFLEAFGRSSEPATHSPSMSHRRAYSYDYAYAADGGAGARGDRWSWRFI